jgi:hypothetical protein
MSTAGLTTKAPWPSREMARGRGYMEVVHDEYLRSPRGLYLGNNPYRHGVPTPVG